MSETLNELHLFSGCGGGILGGMLLGHTCVCAVEIDAYCREVLLQRQRDGILPVFPIWDDVRTFDAKPWRGRVDVVCSGFPCQRHSTIGKIHGSEGFDGWPDTYRVVKEIRPKFVLLENVTGLLRSDVWGRAIGELSILGYDSQWGVFSACSVGEPHTRERVFCLAYPSRLGRETPKPGLAKRKEAWKPTVPTPTDGSARLSRLPEPTIPCRPDELADYMGELKAIGNGQVPAVAALAWEVLGGDSEAVMETIDERQT